MSSPLPPLPDGSCFAVHYDEEGRPRLAWRPPAEPGRWLVVAFLLLWLCGWAHGEMCGLRDLAVGLQNGFPGVSWAGRLVRGYCLLFWTVGGPWAVVSVVAIIRGPGREQFTFGASGLVYEADSSFAARFLSVGGAGPAPLQEFPFDEIEDIRLDGAAGRQRLVLQHRGKLFEIGEALRAPEREWLAEVLRAWMGLPGPP
jgi:hypothetical protein